MAGCLHTFRCDGLALLGGVGGLGDFHGECDMWDW